MPPCADVLIIGAGIVGAAVARELSRAGCTVAALDARLPAATHAGMGHLVVMDDDAAEFALACESMRRWRQWHAEATAGDAAQALAWAWRDTGTLWLAADGAEVAEAQRKQVRLQAGGVAAQWLDAQALREAEPQLAADLAGGLRVPADAIVYAPAVARWLLGQARGAQGRHPAHGGGIEAEGAQVVALEGDGGVRLADGSRRSAAAVVLASGAHTQALCPELPVVPKKGHLVITERQHTEGAAGHVRHSLVELGYIASTQAQRGISVAANIQPRPTGQLLIGSSRQLDSAHTQVDGAVVARMLQRAQRYLPALARMTALRSWAGLRPATPDGLPIIGPHPTRPRLWLAVGHEGLGVTTAPATAALVAAGITGSTLALDGAPYRAERWLAARTPSLAAAPAAPAPP